jgi:hypothetical protein
LRVFYTWYERFLIWRFFKPCNKTTSVAGTFPKRPWVRECTKRTHAEISHLVASLPTSRQQVVFAMLVPSCQQVWNKLLTTCNNLVDIIRIAKMLFQQVRYSHDIAVLLQPCVVNLVTFLFIMTVSDLLQQPCDKSDNAIKLVTSC